MPRCRFLFPTSFFPQALRRRLEQAVQRLRHLVRRGDDPAGHPHLRRLHVQRPHLHPNPPQLLHHRVHLQEDLLPAHLHLDRQRLRSVLHPGEHEFVFWKRYLPGIGIFSQRPLVASPVCCGLSFLLEGKKMHYPVFPLPFLRLHMLYLIPQRM